jgi:hypothetical protein
MTGGELGAIFHGGLLALAVPVLGDGLGRLAAGFAVLGLALSAVLIRAGH